MIKRILRFIRSAMLVTVGLIISIWAGIWIWLAWDLPDARAALNTDAPACEADSIKPDKFTQLHLDALAAVEFPDGINPWLLPSVRVLLTPLNAVTGWRLFHRQKDASTSLAGILLTQMLPPERSLKRQFQQIIVADFIEMQLSEKEIGEALLARMYFGKKAVGLNCAAASQYGKEVDEMSLAQLAMLIGRLKSPTTYDPILSPESAIARRNAVLDIWAQGGLASATDVERAKLDPI
jgi:hypothetical protein